ncbi:LysR substrate-binding domain-containing protein [Brevibacterium samyangense]|uniref:LysR substrate-binding domain-containing protein n=1 Tax=Brevibacterium samyangense TaxID=366888 RepID=A0ABN2T511_9MICO
MAQGKKQNRRGGRPGAQGRSGRAGAGKSGGGAGKACAAGRRGAPGGRGASAKGGAKGAAGAKSPKVVFDDPAGREEPRTLRLGVVPGATPGKWIERWRERMPQVTLDLVEVPAAEAREALLADEVDLATLRRPLEETGLHVVDLYTELPVVVMSAESDLTVAEELDLSDLAGEVLITPGDDVLGGFEVPGTVAPRFDTIPATGDVIATVASGAGITIVPMSLARLHHRRDATYRVLREGPVSQVALAWLQEKDSDDIQTFVGITRGRTANSTR